jgi:hypothetical protein
MTASGRDALRRDKRDEKAETGQQAWHWHQSRSSTGVPRGGESFVRHGDASVL